jgi:hypothetical protein
MTDVNCSSQLCATPDVADAGDQPAAIMNAAINSVKGGGRNLNVS